MSIASLIPLPRAVFYDANGEPLNGGFVYTYVPGGTTPKLTWQDSAQATPNDNPILLDADGSCVMYGQGAYQITVTDSLGNNIPGYSGLSEADPISLAMQPIVSASTVAEAVQLLGPYPYSGAGPFFSLTNAADIVATGTSLATGTTLAAQFNVVSNVAPNTGVVLPAFQPNGVAIVPGTEIAVFNDGTSVLNTYPPVGMHIGSLSPSAPGRVATAAGVVFEYSGSDAWKFH